MSCNPRNLSMASLRLYEGETSIEMIASKYQLDPVSIVDFSLNVNPFGPPPRAIAAAARTLDTTNLYPDIRFRALRDALAARHAVDESCLFFGAGLDEVLKLIIHAWSTENDKILVHVPTFPRYALEATLRGAEVIEVENDDVAAVNLPQMRAMLNRHAIAMTFLCTPNNPTGTCIANADVADLARRHPNTLFIVDEALIYPLENGAVPLIHAHPNVVVLRTFSKYYGLAGLRIGYAIASPELVRIAETGRPPFNVTGPSIQAAVNALQETAFLQHCKSVFAKECDWFTAALDALDRISVRTAAANMLLLDLGPRVPGKVTQQLAAAGVVVADATSFRGLEQSNLLRVSLRSREENAILFNALGAIA
ncbi:pyridoxal phosphate-dependent aminotransferase [Leisingera daeponensis]|uniref:pyridoxal phosphate-dependent aminotransferase n=1 Tax=Leisingera daeponensis TaxID=405746 RepID=UPI001C954E5E|nr:histidinol-phosphate transaminase [Leisingera daeponensis]MBY6058593.1 histidinol-phosphate aminotransferase family protein [Leisingera daeponensis]